jgi:hypothetical protein
MNTHTQILDETSAAVAALEAQQWRASTERSLEYARNLAAKAAATLQVRACALLCVVGGALRAQHCLRGASHRCS